MQTDSLDLKKLVYLYLMNYAKTQPDKAIMAVNTFSKVCMPNELEPYALATPPAFTVVPGISLSELLYPSLPLGMQKLSGCCGVPVAWQLPARFMMRQHWPRIPFSFFFAQILIHPMLLLCCGFSSALFPDVVNCMQTDNLELKKLVYLYLMNYAKNQPDKAIMAVNTFSKVCIYTLVSQQSPPLYSTPLPLLSVLFSCDVANCMQTENLQLQKLVYLLLDALCQK